MTYLWDPHSKIFSNISATALMGDYSHVKPGPLTAFHHWAAEEGARLYQWPNRKSSSPFSITWENVFTKSLFMKLWRECHRTTRNWQCTGLGMGWPLPLQGLRDEWNLEHRKLRESYRKRRLSKNNAFQWRFRREPEAKQSKTLIPFSSFPQLLVKLLIS